MHTFMKLVVIPVFIITTLVLFPSQVSAGFSCWIKYSEYCANRGELLVIDEVIFAVISDVPTNIAPPLESYNIPSNMIKEKYFDLAWILVERTQEDRMKLDVVDFSLNIENERVGHAHFYRSRKVTRWLEGFEIKVSFKLKIPNSFKEGEYGVWLVLPMFVKMKVFYEKKLLNHSAEEGGNSGFRSNLLKISRYPFPILISNKVLALSMWTESTVFAEELSMVRIAKFVID